MDEDLPPPPRSSPDRGLSTVTIAYSMLQARSRFHERLFFLVPGAVALATSIGLHRVHVLAAPFAVLAGFAGILFGALGFLPPVPVPETPPVDERSLRARRRRGE